MLEKAIDNLNIGDVEALVGAGIPEGRRLEYKRDHYGRNDKAKQEFAADVSALANSVGGYLIIGVEEKNGVASKICGVEAEDADGLVRAVVESIRTSIEPQILGVRVRWLAINQGAGVLVIQVDRSWMGPHRVTVAGDSRFFVRDENGKHPMSVSELRQAFLFASELEERIRRFRAERLQLVVQNEGPLAIDDGRPSLLFHVIPRAAFTDGIHIQLAYNDAGIRPLGSSGWNRMYSLDGTVSYSPVDQERGVTRAFTTLFRNGIVEAVANIHAGDQNGRRYIALAGIEQDVINNLKGILSEFERLTIPPPFYVMLSLIGVQGVVPWVDEWRFGGQVHAYRSGKLLLPELVVEAAATQQEVSALLRPLFDLMWNAFGRYCSPNYDAEGQYQWR